MKQSRKLVLRSQRIADLASDELAQVVGGTHVGCGVTHGATCEVECELFSNPVAECLPVVQSLDCFVIVTLRCG